MSYAVWYGRADFETYVLCSCISLCSLELTNIFCTINSRYGNLKEAHEVYVKGCSVRFLDYPEYLLEAWLSFEHQNGTLADLEFAITKVKRQRKGLEAKRYRVSYISIVLHSSTDLLIVF